MIFSSLIISLIVIVLRCPWCIGLRAAGAGEIWMDGKASRRLNQSKSFNLPFSRYAQSCDTARHYLQQEFLRGEPSPGYFLDRDGTLNVDHGYVHEIDNFSLLMAPLKRCRR